MRRTPLAWLFLLHDRKRLVTSTLGVTFAVLLMFVQLGFLNGIYDSLVLPIETFNAELVMVNRLKDDMMPVKPFPRSRLLQALDLTEVEEVYPVYMEVMASWRSRRHAEAYPIRLFGFELSDPVFRLPEVTESLDALARPDTALVDVRSRSNYGALRKGSEGEINGRRVRLVGEFELGPDLVSNGNLITSDVNYFRYVAGLRSPSPTPEQVEFGLLRLRPGADPDGVKERLGTLLVDDVDVLTKRELAGRMRSFWRTNQPVGDVFGMGLVVGFVIGVMICYQVLFTDISDHLPQYATLRAVGYRGRFLVRVAVEQGLGLALLAFAIGLPASLGIYHLLGEITRLDIHLTPLRAVLVLVLSLGMCGLAAALAVRRALRVDPAELF